jgi:hypothetical protein
MMTAGGRCGSCGGAGVGGDLAASADAAAVRAGHGRSRPAGHDLPFSTWSLPKPTEFPVAEGVAGDISHQGLRALLREEGVTFQRLKSWKTCKDPDYAVKKARIEHLYAIADRAMIPEPGEPEVIFCDESGPLNLQPRPGRQQAAISGKMIRRCIIWRNNHAYDERLRRIVDRAT